MNYKIVPLTYDPDQSFQITLFIDGKNITLNLRIRFNTIASYWVMSVYNKEGTLLINSIPLFAGTYPSADLLEQYRYLGLGTAMVINASSYPSDIPDSTNLGSSFLLLWGDSYN